MNEYISKLKPLERNGKVELDLFDYATKVGLKNATGVDSSKFAKKSWFSKFKIRNW